MEDSKKSKVGWTETEKLGLILQIVAKAGKIPWDDLQLPEGRTQKACQVMIDKEKTKLKNASGEDATPKKSPAKKGPAKRKTVAADEKPAKKPRTPKKYKSGAMIEDESDEVEDV